MKIIIRVLFFFSVLSFGNLAHTADLIPGALYAPPPGLDIGMISYFNVKLGQEYKDDSKQALDTEVVTSAIVPRYTRTFTMAQRPAAFYASVPYFQFQPRGVIKDIAGKSEDGVGDLGLAFAYWLYDDKLNGDYLSAVFILEAPTGQYDSDKLLNSGKNRYSFVLNLGGMTRLTDKVAWMMVAGTQWFEDNNDYRLTHQNHEQKNLYTLQNTLMYEPNPKLTLAVSHFIHRGGKTSLGGFTQYENVNTDRWQFFIKMNIDSNSFLLHYGQDYSVENGFKQDRLLIFRFQHLF